MKGYWNFDNLKKFLLYANRLGWYSGRKVLFNLKCEGEFEGSGRASEMWEQSFTLTSDPIYEDVNKIDIPALNIRGNSLDEVFGKALEKFESSNPKILSQDLKP